MPLIKYMEINFSEQVIGSLQEEYPDLQDANLSIERYFNSPDGRIYNAFLMRSTKSGFERFVAKGDKLGNAVDKNQYERMALQLLAERSVPAPRLLYPDHTPERYLLMEYLEGKTASEALEEGMNPSEVFAMVGKALGSLHTVKGDSFGHIGGADEMGWYEQIGRKMRSQKLPGIRPLLPEDFCGQVEEYLERYYPLLQEDEKEGAVFIHKDAYFDNYILATSGDAILIDYGLSSFGRPLFDFGKPCIFDFYRFPDALPAFLEAYYAIRPASPNELDLLRFYLAYEAVGFINFANEFGEHESKQHVVNFLYELIEGNGRVKELLDTCESFYGS